jgi:hypothetical protein
MRDDRSPALSAAKPGAGGASCETFPDLHALCSFQSGLRLRLGKDTKFHLWYCSTGAAESSVRPHGDGDVSEILLAVVLTACASLIIGMLAFGPRILEWIEGTPREPGLEA